MDIPAELLGGLIDKRFEAHLLAAERGIVAGMESVEAKALELGLAAEMFAKSGDEIANGQVLASFRGDPLAIVRGEDEMLSLIGKISGVATAARQAVRSAKGFRIVCGAWKKMPLSLKEDLRSALRLGGVDIRVVSQPFVYLDKNYLRIFGSVPAAVRAGTSIKGRSVVIQIRGETAEIGQEAVMAAEGGASVIMIDTGKKEDLRAASQSLRRSGLRDRVRIAFAGGILLTDLEPLGREDMDMVDIGRSLIDAQVLDFRYDVKSVLQG